MYVNTSCADSFIIRSTFTLSLALLMDIKEVVLCCFLPGVITNGQFVEILDNLFGRHQGVGLLRAVVG